MSAAQQLRASLVAEGATDLDVDTVALIDSIDGETEVFSLVDRIAEAAIADAQLVDLARARAQRLEQRAARNRDLLLRMLQALGLDRIERAVFTASVGVSPPKLVISDASALPPELTRAEPDKNAIKAALKAGTAVPGAMLGNAEPVLRITTR